MDNTSATHLHNLLDSDPCKFTSAEIRLQNLTFLHLLNISIQILPAGCQVYYKKQQTKKCTEQLCRLSDYQKLIIVKDEFKTINQL